MARVNTCIKRLLTIFNIFFAIIGGLVIALALLSQALTSMHGLEGRTAGLVILYGVGSVTMLIAILGAYGAHKESRVCLIVFLVCMVIGSLVMLRAGVPAAVVRPELEGVLMDKFQEFLPLDNAPADVRNMAESVQRQMHCCGLFSYKDWEDNIPLSCMCDTMSVMDGKCQFIPYRTLLQMKSIYTKTCFPIILSYALMAVDIVIGIVFALAALALLGMALASVMIHQLRHPKRPTLVMTIPAIFSPHPPKYEELKNPPEY